MRTNRKIHRMSRRQFQVFHAETQILDSTACTTNSWLAELTFARGDLGKSFNGTNQHPIGPWSRSFMPITREECLKLQRKCWEDCWKRGAPLGPNNRKTYEHWRYCDQLCTEQYLDCLRAAHTSGLVEKTVNWAFGRIAEALDWVVSPPGEG
jgi:hypothetical protein